MAVIVDPKLAIHFVVVVRAGSISAGARELGVAQPWLSEQVRKLEVQFGSRLLIRTSRRMELTEQGRRFHAEAVKLHDANAALQEFAARARQESDQVVVVGASHFTMGFSERIALFDIYQQRNPAAHLEIESGRPEEILQRLRAGEIDVGLINDSGNRAGSDLISSGLGRRYGHLLVPSEDPLSARESIVLADLSGRRLVVSPGRTDIASRQAALHPLIAFGVELVPAPDEDRRMIEQFARNRGLPCLQWNLARMRRQVIGGQVLLPIDGDPIWTEIAAFRRISDERGKILRFFSAVAEERTVHAPSHER